MKNKTNSISYSGSSFSVLSLLTRWLSLAMIVFISESLLRYGIIGVVGIIVMIICAFFVFEFVVSKARITFQNTSSLYELVSLKLTGITKKVMMIYFLILSIGMILIQLLAINFIFDELFDIPLYISKGLAFIVLSICILLIGDRYKTIIEPLYVIILFSTVIFIPTYFFIQKGIQPIYEGIWLYHPYLLFWMNYDLVLFLPTFFLVFFSIILVDRASWNQLFLMKTKKTEITTVLTGLILGTLLLGSMAIMFISLSNGGFDHPSTIMFTIIYYLNPILLLILFICFCFIVCLKAIVGEFNHLIHKLKQISGEYDDKEKRTHKTQIKKVIGLLIVFTVITLFYTPNRLTDAIFIYGLFSVAMITPFLVILYKKQYISSVIVWAVAFGFLGGLIGTNVFGMLLSIWIAFLISTLISLMVFLPKVSK